MKPSPRNGAGASADEEQGLLAKPPAHAHAPPAASPAPGGARGAHTFGLPTVLVAGLSYCVASGSMVLLNKHALNPKSFGFTAPNALLAFQCALAAALVKACELAGLVRLQPLKRDLVAVWFPVNLLFVAMIGTSFYALQHVGVAMVTVWWVEGGGGERGGPEPGWGWRLDWRAEAGGWD